MIEAALRLIIQELDQALRLQSPGGASLVVLSGLADSAGNPLPDVADKLAVFLVNIEREDAPMRAPRRVDAGADRLAIIQPPVHLNLMVMFAANFTGPKYNEALKQVANTIAFFQAKPVFTALNTPGLDPAIDQLNFEIETLSITDLSNLWGVIGGRYMPSALYRVRMITIDSQRLISQPRRVEQALASTAPVGVT